MQDQGILPWAAPTTNLTTGPSIAPAVAPSTQPSPVTTAPTTPQTSGQDMRFTDQDIADIKKLMDNGIPQEDAIHLVAQLKQSQTPVAPTPEKPWMLSQLGDSLVQSGKELGQTLGGAVEKTWEAFMSWARQTADNIDKGLTGQIKPWDATVGVLAGLGNTLFSPLSGLTWQASEEIGKWLIQIAPQGNSALESIGSLPDQYRQYKSEQSTEQQQNMTNIENSANLLGMVWGVKGGPWALDAGAAKIGQGIDAATSIGTKIGDTAGAVWTKIGENIPSVSWVGDGISSKVQSMGNSTAESLLSSQWKLDRKTNIAIEEATGMKWEKFALENNLVWPDVAATADNAAQFKISQMEDKINAVKDFGDTMTPAVAKRMAKAIEDDLSASLAKGVGAKDLTDLTPEQTAILNSNPDMVRVINAMQTIKNSTKASYSQLEALKSLYDHYNPDNIKWEFNGRPSSESMHEVAAGQRGTLQKLIEDQWIQNGVDIKQMNSNIQAAFALENGADKAAWRIANHNLISLWDTQIAALAAIVSGAPWAAAGLILKKALFDNQWIRAGIARKLYTKNAQTPNLTPSPTISPVSRVGRIMRNIDGSTNSGIKPKKSK